MTNLKNKKIMICITGSIAAYKVCETIRILRKEGVDVWAMMSKSSQQFIGKATIAALTNHEVIDDLFPDSPKAGIEHIDLVGSLDAIVILPATANILCKVGSGVADEIISTTLSAWEGRTVFVPAMNFRMWRNQSTQQAVEQLRTKGMSVLNPEEGQLATLHSGKGRLPHQDVIMNGIRNLFSPNLPLNGKHVLVTAGPTIEKIDPVRYISNFSSGKMGYAIAERLKELGASVTLIRGVIESPPPPGLIVHDIKTTSDLLKVTQNVISKQVFDYFFMVAAPADFYIDQYSNKKIKREKSDLTLSFKSYPDILKTLTIDDETIVIAFALETHNGKREAQRKMDEKGVDYIVLNYAGKEGVGMGSKKNEVVIFSKDGNEKKIAKNYKSKIASGIIDYVI